MLWASLLRVALQDVVKVLTGCRCTIGKFEISLCGRVSIKGGVLHNPLAVDVKWSGSNLLEIGEVTADVALCRLFRTLAYDIVINEVTLKDLVVTYEQPSTRTRTEGQGDPEEEDSSNMYRIWVHLKHLLPKSKKCNCKQCVTDSSEAALLPPPPPAPPPPRNTRKPGKGRKVRIKKIDIDDVELIKIGGYDGAVRLRTFMCENFSDLTGIERMESVLLFVIDSIASSVLFNVTGKPEYEFGDVTKALLEYI